MYTCVIPGSIEIFDFILFEETGVCDIDSHVPSTVPDEFNLLQVASITSSLFVIVFVKDCHTKLYLTSSVPVFLTLTSFVNESPGITLSSDISFVSVYVNSKSPVTTLLFFAVSLPVIIAENQAYDIPSATTTNNKTATT